MMSQFLSDTYNRLAFSLRSFRLVVLGINSCWTSSAITLKITQVKFNFLLIRRWLNGATVIRKRCLFVPVSQIFIQISALRILLCIFLIEDQVWSEFIMRFESYGAIVGIVRLNSIGRSEVRRDWSMLKRGMLMSEAMSIFVGMVYWLIRMHIVISAKSSKYHCLKDTLYPPFAPCSALKLSKLSPKNPNMLFPIFFKPSITSFFCFSFFSSTACYNCFILTINLTSLGFISSSFLFWFNASSSWSAFS